MTDNDNWQKKPDEGGFSARRDGDRKPFENRGNSSERPRFGGSNNGNSFDKPRRSFGDNANSGNSFDRPRRTFGEGGSTSSDRPRFGGNSGGNDRPRFGGGGNSYDKPRSFGGDSDRPRPSFNKEGGNSYDRGNSFDKPRSFGGDSDRPRRPFNNEGGNSFDRPRRSYGESDSGNSFSKPRSFGNDSDRPRFGGNSEGGDRPRRPFNSEGGNSGNSFDKPRRSFGDSGNSFDRPQRSFGDNDRGNDRGNSFEKPRRSFGEGSDRPRPSFNREGGDRPSFNREGGDRPRSNYGDRSERPRTSYGEHSDRPSFGDRPRFNSSPSLPRPEREDGRPRRPRIAKAFDHGKPFGRPAAPNYPVFMDPDTPVRLNKYLANAGICSRREADEFIQAGVVRVNGEVVSELGVKVKPTDTILFHDQAVSIEHKIYILLNKPKDCVTTSDDPQERTTVMDLVKGACAERIYPVGRLDRNTTGVLLLTNDGDLASKLTHPKFEKRKIYQATLDKNIEPEDIQKILDGITLEDCEVKADNCSYVDQDKGNVVGIEIHTGQNRVVRRIFESLGYKVFKLDRVYFAGLTKKNLPRGKWRHLSEKEVGLLKMGAFV